METKEIAKVLFYLILLEFILCIIFFVISIFTKNEYFRGVAVGLLIAWVTGAIAYLRKVKEW